MPAARRMLSGVDSALFMARRIQAGLAANIRPSSTNRIPTPMRKSANAMDLIGLQPPVGRSFYLKGGEAELVRPPSCHALPYGFGAAGAAAGGAAAAGGLPDELLKNL